MAYGPGFLRHVIALKQRGLLDGSRRVVEIGRQQINDRLIASPVLDEAIALFGGTKPELTPVGTPRIGPHSPPGRLLWSAFGMQSKSVDIDGGDIHIDLNKGRVPWRYRCAFDLAVNAGTTEHVANQGNAFAAIHDLVRPGGLMVHQVPAYGNIDHGFFGYQPKFFHRLSKANEYEVAQLTLIPQAEIDLPAEYRGDGLPLRVLPVTLLVVMRRKDRRKFVMPADA
jgi:SAM-dependent methyltransferase